MGKKFDELRKKAAAIAKAEGMPTTELRTKWKLEQLETYLETGEKPRGSSPAPPAEAVYPIVPVAAAGIEAVEIFRKIADTIGTCSTFMRKNDNKPVNTKLTWKMFQHDTRDNKDGKLFIPAICSGGRKKEHFRSASGICLDFDYGTPSVERVLELFPGTLAVYYSTHSHGWTSKERTENEIKIEADTAYTPENPRFRVVIPLSRPVDSNEHERLAAAVKSIITPQLMECLDASCLERTRPHYLPSCLPGHKQYAFTGYQDGNPLDVDNFLSLAATLPAEIDRPKAPTAEEAQLLEYPDLTTGEMLPLAAWAANNPTFDIIAAVNPQYFRGNPLAGKQHIVCPFEDQHTDQGDDLATFIANASPPQYKAWDVHCCHAHCVDRDRLEFIEAMLEKGWLSVDQLQPTAPAVFELKRPPYINYRAQEIAAGLVKQPLQPEEFRYHLHLMHVAWTAYDGTLPDDDWIIHRILGVTEDQWLGIKPTLIRSGWLDVEGGRLFNPITLREYRVSQDALARKISGGKIGGLKTQQRKKDREAHLKG